MALLTLQNVRGINAVWVIQLWAKKPANQSLPKPMAPNKAEAETEEAWGRHREELKSLWLEQRMTVQQVQDYMSKMHNFWKE
jgi:hypoxanthine phosphoribosyltransferase